MPGLYSHTTRANGTTLTATIYNSDHVNHITNQTPDMTDDYSTDVTQMRSTADPYPGASASLPTHLAGELERLRYVIAQITGQTYWYIDPSTSLETLATAAPLKPLGFLHGLTLSNNGSDATNDIDIAVGQAVDNSDGHNMVLASGLTKRLDANWAVGTNEGMLDTGSIANTTYHIFLIKRTDTGVVDILASTSATSPTMPTNYTKKRRIGSILRESAAIVAFIQDGDRFDRKDAKVDYNLIYNPGTDAVTRTMSVPNGIIVDIVVNGTLNAGSNATQMVLSPLDCTDQTTTAGLSQIFANASGWASGQVVLRSNTSGQIRSRLSVSDASTAIWLGTRGWIDKRGRTH